MKTRKRVLKFWNGINPANNVIHMYVSATSRGKAAELITKASGFKVNSVFVKTNLNTVWGEPMQSVAPEEGIWFFNQDTNTLNKHI